MATPCNTTSCIECVECLSTNEPDINFTNQIDISVEDDKYPLRYDQYLALGIYITIIGMYYSAFLPHRNTEIPTYQNTP